MPASAPVAAVKGVSMKRFVWQVCGASLALWAAAPALGQGGNAVVYRCPGPPVLYTDAISAQEAKNRGCRTIEGAPITVLQSPKPRPVQAAAPPPPSSRPADSRVEPSEQRERDNDRRRILESELRRETQRLTDMQREFNEGEPERRGDERNYARYQERVAQMQADISRKESDIAAIQREIAKLPN
jgi:hypothetical protein